MNKLKCPTCNTEVDENELIASVVHDELICCPNCRISHRNTNTVVIGTDAALVWNEANERKIIRK